MSKWMVAVVSAALLSGMAGAAVTNKNLKALTPAEQDELFRRVQLKRIGGGFIKKPESAKGVFVVLNAQNKVATVDIRPVLKAFDDRFFSVQASLSAATDVTPSNIEEKIRAAGGAVGIAVVDDPALAGLITAPEARWSMVNVAKLAENCPDAATLAARLRKEIVRAYAFTLGGAYMTMADPLMRDVVKPSDLDALQGELLGPEILNRLGSSAPLYGIRPWRIVSYRDACEQGWAPEPTNEYQRAAWKKVHAVPTKPIKIKFDPDKDK